MRQTPNVLEVQERARGSLDYHHAKFGGTRILPAAGAAENVEFFVCLSVCLFVTLLNVRVCAPDFAMKALEYRSDFDPRASTSLLFCRFVVVHTCSTFSDCCQFATPLNAEVRKTATIGFFFANRGRQNKPIETKFGT